MGGHRKQHEGEYLAQVVVDLAEVGKLADQIEEGKQAQEPQQHEARGRVDLTREVTLERAHASAYFPIRSRISCMRRANMNTSRAIIPACTSHQPTPKSMRPCATRAWLTLRRFEYTM